jgi:hypothetical protein
MTTRQIELSAGTLYCRDSGGDEAASAAARAPPRRRLDQPVRLAQLIRELTHQLDTATP